MCYEFPARFPDAIVVDQKPIGISSIAPVKATCDPTKMEFAGYVYTGDVSYLSRTDEEAREAIVGKAKAHAARVVELVESL